MRAINTPWATLLSIHDRLPLAAMTLRLAAGAAGGMSGPAAMGLADVLTDMQRLLKPIVTGDVDLPFGLHSP
jgi:hypothetical protein